MISVIVPVYNVVSSLDKCVQSIVCQDYTDWECILVDDGSTDGSGLLCDQWSERDSRIRVIHQENQGVSAARNRGIEESCGQSLVFVDSDDWVEPTYISLLVENSKDADLVVSGLFREKVDGGTDLSCPLSDGIFMIGPEGAHFFTQLNESYLLYAPYNKLYRSDIVKNNHVLFPVGCSYGEDLRFNFHYLEYVNSIYMVNAPTYHYMQVLSVLSRRFRADQFENDYNQWCIRRDFFVKKGMFTKEAQTVMYRFLWGIIYDGLFLYPKLKDVKKHYLESILGIKEIDELKSHTDVFSCGKWIKWAIMNNCPIVFYIYFKSLSFFSHNR